MKKLKVTCSTNHGGTGARQKEGHTVVSAMKINYSVCSERSVLPEFSLPTRRSSRF